MDTANWDNGASQNCEKYAEKWCANGKVKPGKESTLGQKYKFPENNCCVCGKAKSSK